jgi:hypothetical protein
VVDDENNRIGKMVVTVEILDALKSIQNELRTIELEETI